MIQINLIPDVKRDLLRANAMRNWVIFLSIVVGVASIVVIVLVAGILGAQSITSEIQKKEIKDRFQELSNIQDVNETIIVQNQLSEISNLRNSAPNISRILRQIIVAIKTGGDNEVRYSQINYDPASRTLTIEGQAKAINATDSFKKAINETKILYRNELKEKSCTFDQAEKGEDGCYIDTLLEAGKTAEISDLSRNEEQEGELPVRFKASLVLNPKALLFETKNFAVKSPNNKDVTDSTITIPDGMFTAKIEGSEAQK